ncbi:MAG: STAS domain-containing protein [Candidatus Omnitrophica bacterium]|nr:STAS domain-containing protein [Candidatus Omnitrophota bacterium]
MNLNVTVSKKEEGVFILKLIGSLETDTYLELEKVALPLINSSIKAIILDMKDLDYISSLGLSAIFKIKAALEKNKAVLLITNLKPKIHQVFNLIKALPESLFETMQEADEYLDKFLSDIEKE